MDLGLLAINTLNESGVLGTPATRIRRRTDGSHWGATDHIFGEETYVGMSVAKSDHNYNYKTDFEIWRENKEFERKFFSMSRPPLYRTPIDTNTKNAKTSHLNSTIVGTKMPDPQATNTTNVIAKTQ